MTGCTCMFFPPGHRLPQKYGLGAAALRYAALGYEVIPLARGGKRPHPMLGSSGGIHLASKDPDQIMDWWSLDMVANIGVATGSRNRLVVIDMDVKGGHDGMSEFYSFLAVNKVGNTEWAGLEWPREVPTVQTPSGGAHLWLRMDGEVPERPGILRAVDVKGEGGLVVAPPSMQVIQPMSRPGERNTGEVPVPYDWVSSCPHAAPDVPLWFPGWLAFATPAPRTDHERTTASGAPLDECLDSYLKTGIPSGMRNRETYRIACGLYRRHGTDTGGAQKVMEVIRSVYAATDKNGFTWREVQVCLESARRFVEKASARENARNAEFLAWLERRHW